MNSYLTYRASFYLMLTVATTVLSVESPDSRFSWLFPMVVLIAGVLAFLTVDQKSRWSLPRGLANLLALSTLGLLYFEYKLDETQLIRCLGHWLIYLQVIKYFLPKSAEDDWFLFLVGLMQVLIGSVMNQSDQVGLWLFVWAMLAVWVLGQFFLQREVRRLAEPKLAGNAASLAAIPLGPSRKDPYRGLFDIPYVMASLRVLAMTLALGGFFFLLLPRQVGATRSRIGGSMSKHLTGFDDEVQLGQLGEILENDSIVMTVEFTDEDRRPIEPPPEPLWRGVTLFQYENGRWRRQSQRFAPQTLTGFPIFKNNGPNRRKVIRQAIKLEPNDAANLFAIRPILEFAAVSRLSPYMNPVDGSIFRPDPRGAYDYEILSEDRADAPQFGESPPSRDRRKALLAMPKDLKEKFQKIALPLVKDIPAEGEEGVAARARAVETFLRSSGEFGYTLDMNVVDRNLDPVEDFLVNRKEGHCEYFASALALLLRSIDIPARMVNGFKGGDWNQLTQTMTVRQKHAHSWVEAYAGAGPTPDGTAQWIILDPTPGGERARSVAQVGGVGSSFRPLTDIVRYVWVFYILGYDSSRQNRLLYTPIRVMVREVRRGYSLLWSSLKEIFARLFHFENLGAFISIKGFVVSFMVLSLVAVLARLLAWIAVRLLSWWRGPDQDKPGLTAGILFYRRLAQLLSDYDLQRTPAETQNEFAHRATRFLSAQGARTQGVVEVPQKIVDAFYQVRFGQRDLEPQTLQELEDCLDALQNSLKQPAS